MKQGFLYVQKTWMNEIINKVVYMRKDLTLIATAAMGIESVVAREVRNLGFSDVNVENGKVFFKGDEQSICRANLWLRSANRIKILVGEFKATTFDELFEQTKALPWADFIPENGEFPVIGKSVKSTLYSVPDCQAIVKKAVVESMKKTYKRTSWFEEDGPLYRIEVSILKDIATLTIDTTGDGLHKRGYRELHNEAPLKETMAATLIQLTTWNPDRIFVDPFCGSGTLPIEAALIGRNIAPGLHRTFASSEWDMIGEQRWKQEKEAAMDVAEWNRPLEIYGSDINHSLVELSKENARKAGIGDTIQFKQMQVRDFRSKEEYGIIVCNPPYGERLSDREQVEELYKEMGETFKMLDTWSIYVLTAHLGFERFYGKKASKKRKLFNGYIRTDYFQYFGPRPPRKENLEK